MLQKRNHGAVRPFLWLMVLCVTGLVLVSCAAQQVIGNEGNETEKGLEGVPAVRSGDSPDQSPEGKQEGRPVNEENDLADGLKASGEPELLAEIPEAEAALYAGERDGVVLYWGDKVSAFDWSYMTPRGIMPRMYLDDFDGDEEQELAVILYNGSGAGISVEELHIVDKSDAGLEDRVFDQESCIRQLREAVDLQLSVQPEGRLIGKLRVGDQVYEAVMPFDDPDEFDAVSDFLVLGNVVSFEWSENGIQGVFGAAVHKENSADIRYFGYFHADVLYRDGDFELVNLRFEAISP